MGYNKNEHKNIQAVHDFVTKHIKLDKSGYGDVYLIFSARDCEEIILPNTRIQFLSDSNGWVINIPELDDYGLSYAIMRKTRFGVMSMCQGVLTIKENHFEHGQLVYKIKSVSD